MTELSLDQTSVLIRPFQPEDELLVVALWRRAGVTRAWNDPARDIFRKLSFQPNWFLLAEIDRAIVGTVMIGFEGHRGWINYLAVCPDHRRQGIGKLLMHHAEQRLLEIGCPKINLQIRIGNEEAFQFYRAIGFLQDEVVSMGKRLIEDSPAKRQTT